MKLSTYLPGAKRARFRAASLATLAASASAVLLVVLVTGAQAAAVKVPLGTADSFAVLAGTGVTNTGPTTLKGDLGTFPTTTITGAGSLTQNGVNHAGDAVTQGAKTDLVIAYGNAAGQGPTSPIVADLGGQTLTPGVYNSGSSIALTGSLTLNAGGNPSAVFVFQAGSALTTASSSSVNLVNGAQSCNVFWQVGSSATLGTGSTFRGTIIALTDITLTTGATVDGRVLARNGAVTLDTNTITRPTCAAVVPPPTEHEIYCDPVSGKSYDLLKGQDKAAPYDKLGLVLSHKDPVTGAKSCDFIHEEAVAAAAAKTAAEAAAKAVVAAEALKVEVAKAAALEAIAAAKKAEAAALKAGTAKAAAAAKLADAKAAVARAAAVKAAAAVRTHASPAQTHVGLTG